MERIYIKDLKEHIDKEVTIKGWVETRRGHGKLTFLDIRDVTGVVQAVVTSKSEEAYKQSEDLRGEWVVEVTGMVKERPEKMVNKETEQGTIELGITDITILGKADELPFEKGGELNLDTYLDHLPLTLRTERARAIFKVQSRIINAFRRFLLDEDFVEFQAPKIIGEDAEGGTSVFDIEYFGKMAHLAQSPQFYKQIMVGVFEKVFTTGNVFRAEKHSTSRHINEYTSLDIEFGFIKDHMDVIALDTRLMKYITQDLKEHAQKEFALLGVEIPELPDEPPVLKLKEVQEIIKKHYGEDCIGESDLSPQHERWIGEYVKKEHGSDFVYVTHYPVDKRPMYAYEDEEDLGYTKSFDLLFRGIEIQSGGQRIHDYDTLVEKMKKKGLDPEKFSFYLQAFRYGMPPHGGFGMGLERLTAQFLGVDNVKEATLFPRDMNRIDTLLSE